MGLWEYCPGNSRRELLRLLHTSNPPVTLGRKQLNSAAQHAKTEITYSISVHPVNLDYYSSSKLCNILPSYYLLRLILPITQAHAAHSPFPSPTRRRLLCDRVRLAHSDTFALPLHRGIAHCGLCSSPSDLRQQNHLN